MLTDLIIGNTDRHLNMFQVACDHIDDVKILTYGKVKELNHYWVATIEYNYPSDLFNLGKTFKKLEVVNEK